jgi:hypothetical protein
MVPLPDCAGLVGMVGAVFALAARNAFMMADKTKPLYHCRLQDLRQPANQDTQIASSVMSNPYTRVCFRLGDQDARKLAEGFSFFEPQDLQNLGIGEAVCRIERAEYDFNLKTLPLPQVDAALAKER